jgi:hypothetical protein
VAVIAAFLARLFVFVTIRFVWRCGGVCVCHDCWCRRMFMVHLSISIKSLSFEEVASSGEAMTDNVPLKSVNKIIQPKGNKVILHKWRKTCNYFVFSRALVRYVVAVGTYVFCTYLEFYSYVFSW